MTQINNSNNISTKPLHNPDNDTYTYNGTKVKIITVFTDNGVSTALVENKNGDLFEVAKDKLN